MPKSNIYGSLAPKLAGPQAPAQLLTLSPTLVSADCSSDFVLSSPAVSVSSAMPFLKLLMPLATSPIKSEILPRPNKRTTTKMTRSQCQIESEPIYYSLGTLGGLPPQRRGHYRRKG